jgi:membrane protein DedA with SNARE-associated domain/pimeloyl-ACP methyl ester carboxylesterase
MLISAERKSNLGRVPRKWWLVSAYLLLLALSATFPFFSAIETADKGDPIRVPAFDYVDDKLTRLDITIPIRARLHGVQGGEEARQSAQLVFRKKVIVYLHRIPWDQRGSQFCAELARDPDISVIEPFLPGFRNTSGAVPNHSMEVNAEVVAGLVEHFGLKEYHVIGQGYGGIAALELASSHPDRVRSLTLISSPGAQEFELMGNPLVNKIVYGFQGAGLWFFSRLTPSFGAVDLLPVDGNYAQTVFDTDMTESKKLLSQWTQPLLLIHGEDDWMTAVETARYSALLAPQAKLAVIPGGRDAAFEAIPEVAGKVRDFTAEVAGGAGARVTSPSQEYPPMPLASGMRYWILLLVILLCTFVAEDPTCLASGLMVSVGIIDFWSAAAACTIGIFIGDTVLYSVGRFLGRKAIRKAPLKWFIKEHKVNQWAGWFSTPKGMLVVVSSRFVPASRVPTFVSAGIMKLNALRLGLLLLVAALIWTPPLMWLGYTYGSAAMDILYRFKNNALWVIIGFLFLLHFLTHWMVPALTWRGRRQIVMKVRGFLQPSLWPSALLYLPIRLGILWLCLRYRRLTAFASANPAFGVVGGFIGDTKSLLLRPFQRDSRCCPTLALSLEDSQEERVKQAAAFAACHAFPVVFKPEVAEDGAGLRYVANQEQLERLVRSAQEDFLLQKFIPGLEFEVVWRRNPGKDDGHVMTLVQKRDVTVRGDGAQTLEELIWLDEVAVSRGELFIQCHARGLNRIVPAGEKVTLNLSGSYGHGARCLRRQDLVTTELDLAMGAFAKRFPGLHFARFDLRAGTIEDLKAGRFIVTEVGGCCHVSSLLRDSALRFSRSYAIVWVQLKVCLEAGAYNLSQNVRPVPLSELMARWSQARGRADEFAVSEES